MSDVWIYILIFVAKMIEVSLATVRVVLINRGEKIRGSIIGFFEVMIWVLVVGNVLGSITEDPLKVFLYCLAFALGNYVGSIIEHRLAIGTACIQVVVSDNHREELTTALRDKGFGVTLIKGEGKNGPVDVLMIYLKRKRIDDASETIHQVSPSAVLVVNDVRGIENGFLKK